MGQQLYAFNVNLFFVIDIVYYIDIFRCAYANTPKFNQVKGKGKIVTRKWIEDCYRDRKRYPWRRYALDKADKTGNESEEEIWEKVDTPPASPKDNGGDTEDEIEAIINSTK